MESPSQPQLRRREGDAIHISGDYQARALTSDRAAQRFWHEAKFRLIQRVAMPSAQDRVLDAGCGSGTISQFLSLYSREAIGMDSNPSAIAYASDAYKRPNLHFRLGQFEELTNDKPFDIIYCIEVIEHLYENQVKDVLSVFHKLTKPGGRLFLTTPNYRSAWPVIEWLLDRFSLVATLDEAQHVTHFTKRKLSAMCECTGWGMSRMGTFNGLAPFLAPISRHVASAMENLEFSLNWLLPQNLLFCLCTKKF
ncbi:MAG TPA: class I SAM-dependent methyltransferase [Candidatus Udaeobacter sp.]|nr:class I SAM-dependent methyltransferase [Candidatus Udaeobacter sp.]